MKIPRMIPWGTNVRETLCVGKVWVPYDDQLLPYDDQLLPHCCHYPYII